MPQENPSQTKGSDDAKFFITIAVLLVLIIATLAALWMRERSARRDAQSAMPDQLKSLLAQLDVAHMPSTASIDRADLQVRTVNLDGESRQAFTITPAVGERMGFLPGDVVIVAQPASQPAMQASPTTAVSTTVPAEVE